MSAVVQINNLSKKFGDFAAVDHLSLEIKKGECFGFIGPRGSGKSTLLRVLYGGTSITTGEAFVLGLNVKDHIIEIKSRIGIVPQQGGIDPELTVLENFQVFSKFYDLQPIHFEESLSSLLRRLKLEDKIDRLLADMTIEDQKRVSLGRALIHKPDLIIVDDIFTELSSRALEDFHQFFQELKNEGLSIILSANGFADLEKVCDRVGIMDYGKLLISGPPVTLKAELIGQEVLEFDAKSADINYYLQKIRENNFDYQVYHNTVHIFVKSPRTLKEAYALISGDRMVLRKPNLGDVYLRLSGALLEAK